MLAKWLLAAAHLLALGIGLGAIWARAQALRPPVTEDSLRRTFRADTWWGAAAGVWVATGLARLLMETEKPIAYYMHSDAFIVKMALLGLILALEVWPMTTLMRWRRVRGGGAMPSTDAAATFANISVVQLVLVILMVLAATAMARGLWA